MSDSEYGDDSRYLTSNEIKEIEKRKKLFDKEYMNYFP